MSNASQGFDWIIGLSSFEIDETNYRSDDGAYGDPFDGYDTFYSTSSFSSDFSSKSKSIFGSIDLRLDNNFILSFGARWEDWEANYKDSNQESFKPSDNMNGGKISLSNNQSENSTFFASVAKGYKLSLIHI